MADASDIAAVRDNTDELTDANWTDDAISALIDADGVAGASATIWTRKAAKLASAVDVTEAGASHKNSDLYKNALAMAKSFQTEEATVEAPTGRPVIRQIER